MLDLKKYLVKLIEIDKVSCGASRDRTDDPLLAKQVLSHLSYSPV